MFTYASFTPGEFVGSGELLLDDAQLNAWKALFPEDDLQGVMPQGMVAVLAMRAYADVVHSRPPGNVHAAQRFDLYRLPESGDLLTTRITCLGKEERKGRLRVTLGMETSGPDGAVFSGRMTVLWAA